MIKETIQLFPANTKKLNTRTDLLRKQFGRFFLFF
uniref:Uncharacterized protein n=1 Tax=Anguilla anguilla TaxID=7936 RepID=A0A0E9PD68_ANGAN